MNGASHSTAAGPLLNGSTNMAVFITHYCTVPFLYGQTYLPLPAPGGNRKIGLIGLLVVVKLLTICCDSFSFTKLIILYQWFSNVTTNTIVIHF